MSKVATRADRGLVTAFPVPLRVRSLAGLAAWLLSPLWFSVTGYKKAAPDGAAYHRD
ncbi:MAG: hypothetical protein AAFP97_00305 [Pseudomonadota bacterium]